MPFDPKKSGDAKFGGYTNPYASQHYNQHNSKKPNYALFAIIGVVVTAVIIGVVVFSINASKMQIQNQNDNNSSVVNKSDYVEVEIFDVEN